MTTNNSLVSWFWKLPVCMLAFAVGSAIGGSLVMALGIELPRLPAQSIRTQWPYCCCLAA